MNTLNKNIQIKPSKKKGEKKVSIVLKNELTIFSIEQLQSKIIDTVKKYDEIEFNLNEVSNMDLTFIQLFFSVKITADSQKKKVRFNENLSDDIKTLFINSDLYKVLN